MSPHVIGIIGLCALLLLMGLGVPIAVSFAVVGFVGTIFLMGPNAALANLGIIPWHQSIQYTLMCLPLFLLMGYISYHAGISQDLFTAAYKWIGRLRGGLGYATVAACTGFATCSGSSLASVATMSLVAYPEMKRYHYDEKLAVGTVAAGGTLAILIPPSTGFIIYGVLAEESIGKLFIAGVLPGLLLAVLFAGVIAFKTTLNPSLGPPAPPFPWMERLRSLSGVWGILVIFALVTGGIYTGIFTATEAAGIGAFGTLIICLLRKKLTLVNLRSSLESALRTSCMIFLIIIGASLFNYFLALSGLTTMLAEWAVNLPFPPLLVVGVMVLLYVPLGCFMEVIAMVVLTTPIFVPVVQAYGFSLIWFGVLQVILSEMAQITPPVGLAVFVAQATIKEIPMQDVFKGVFPFVIADAACAAIVFVLPQVALFLPGMME